jgi:hypothetical protein
MSAVERAYPTTNERRIRWLLSCWSLGSMALKSREVKASSSESQSFS